MPRKYTKSSDWWEKRKNNSKVTEIINTVSELNKQVSDFAIGNIEYDEVSLADSNDDYARTSTSSFSSAAVNSRFPNISRGMLPYKTNGSIITLTDAIKLCQLAYTNIAIVRNTVETAVEFSSTKVHVRSDNKTVEKFFNKWFKKINLWKISDEFFREYYRSGNIFFYRFDGKFDSESYNALKSVFALKSNDIPLAYTILNPAEIGVEWTPLGYGSYVKMISFHELQKLRESKDPAIKEFVAQFDAKSKKQLYTFAGDELYMTIDPDRLSFVFYKKQAYEPLAVPMVFPVLDDLEWKLSLKNMDKVLAKSIDNILLLITMGAKKDEGGINYNNITRMQTLFKNQAAGRVIVSDYTTKAEFLVPDLQNILGPEKYQVVDKDIKEGLQNILAGGTDEKFSNLAIKTKVFLERLREGQNAFKNWLEREVLRVCEIMNFKNVPELIMEEIDLEDKNLAQKTFVRLYELGLFTPEDLIEAFRSGLMPDINGLLQKQKIYTAERNNEQLWTPLLGGSQKTDNGRPTGTGTPKDNVKQGVRTNLSFANLKIPIDSIEQTYNCIDAFSKEIEQKIKEKMALANLDEQQNEFVKDLTTTIVTRYNKNDWGDKIDYIFNNLDMLENTAQLQTIKLWASEAKLDEFNTAVLYHANNLSGAIKEKINN